ncbi:LytTR family transcriptional regulator DNA-binding domain-containing protein [Pedobacter sp. MR2016-19]|uniref:LytTR family transcriptional regulator DNA-binding domain-containing protein n=1 Tax=Pedobacter sp. MR2016-19 TaxID=2780089 RepID=UPI001873D016|nr:LytTR family transcriptional regulator DNA-binding domain-containing protein [Pedobacter sp. MR2016-19]MBE5320778.1 LytTR family transcriptional regulator DNA-binding domain-containing protein [Pedobacter sp. MR2016-19]
MLKAGYSTYYRANRQFIISLNAIKTIYIYGKNQLKIVVSPEPDEVILISKNKVSEFKKWLDR